MRIYTKDLNVITKVRKERQEYHNKRFEESMMKNYLLSLRCARQLLNRSKGLVNREELGKLIANYAQV